MFGQSQTLVMGFSQGVAQPGSPAKKAAKQEDRQTCLPVTIRSIEGALDQSGGTSDEVRIHGAEHGMLMLVAAVESLTKQSTSMELSLNDGTGRIKARYYITDQQPKDVEQIDLGRYVSVFGNVRTSPSLHFVVLGMRLVQTTDEVSYHMIESAHAALKIQQGAFETSMSSPKKVASAPAQFPTSEKKGEGMEEMVAPALPAIPTPQASLEGSALRNAIVVFLQQEGDSHPEGSALESVITHAKPTFAEHVRKVIEDLVDAGEIFTTIDDEHFSCV